ncbi:Bug family tripartite tricarboxylate transporter substrate binding protein [Rhodoplanes roseus]|uniref:Bug family tripartite tricarboxylate transporter substrate binding protein n=1 Tax=Rhodoplanes roseus TaxID=29409 RepID=UPI001472E786|nr:tripartite tricarboxylate transporter substrate binding protein [Rhodoplanes roseus]
MASRPAAAQPADWPNRPIKIVVGYPAGGSADVTTRLFAEPLSRALGQAVVVENRSGAGGTLGVQAVLRSEPDGYTLYGAAISEISLAPATVANLPYDPVKDLEPVMVLTRSPYILVGAPTFPPSTLKELVDYTKAHPGTVSYSSFGANTLTHLAGERFKLAVGINALHVPYRGSSASLADLMGGQVQFTFDSPAVTLNLINAGKLKGIAVVSKTRLEGAPSIPTFAEAGYPDFSVTSWIGMLAPAKTPKPIIDRLNKELNTILQSDEIKSALARSNIQPGGGTPDEFRRQIQTEIAEWKDLAPKIGIEPTR